MSKTGSIVFDNLALLFAMGVAIGMAKKENEVAALSGAIGYLIMNNTISTLISVKGGASVMAANSTTSVLGITTPLMGVLGRIIVALESQPYITSFTKYSCRRCFPFSETQDSFQSSLHSV